jgi:hypothetical protein
LADRLRAAHTLPIGISIDTVYCHAAWAEQLGGVSFPLISDFHPKGELAEMFGAYLPERGITDRATVILDANGTVHYAETVGTAGRRDVETLVALCEKIDAQWSGPPLEDPVAIDCLAEGTVLYIKDNCMFSRWALYARTNLHLEARLPVINVSRDPAALAELERLGGKSQAPALAIGGTQVLYESVDIAKYLSEHCG